MTPSTSAARPALPMPERTGDCPYCGGARRLWRVGTVLICSGCMFRAMREADSPSLSAARQVQVRGRAGGKTTETRSAMREAIDNGEHAHSLAVGKPTRCWNGDPRCPAWREQGGDLPDSIEVY